MSTATAKKAKLVPPSDLVQIWTVARLEIQRNLRRKRLIACLAIVIAICAIGLAIIPALGGSYPSDPILGPYQFSQIFLEFGGFLAILIAVFFGGDPIVSEFHGKTGYTLFPNPVKRSSIFLGKILSSLIATFIVIGLFYLIITISMVAIYQKVPIEMLYSFGFAFLYVTALIAVAYLISSLMKTTMAAMILTFFLLLFILPIITTVLTFAGYRPDAFLNFQAGIVTGFMAGPFPEFYPPDLVINDSSGFTFTFFQPKVDIGIIVCFIWMIIAFILAYFFFRRREMLG